MKLVVTEKNLAAKKLSEILADGKPKSDKVYSTPIYRFTHAGEEWAVIGLKGHILEVDFPQRLVFDQRDGWRGVEEDGSSVDAVIPDKLDKPPFSKRKPFSEDGLELGPWKIAALPYLVYAPVVKEPKEKEIIRSLKNLAGKSDSIVIATDFDREGELIGAEAEAVIADVAVGVPISRARYSALTKEEITRAFDNLVPMDEDLAMAGESRQDIDLVWGAVLTRYLSIVKRAGLNSVRSAGRVQTPTLALVANRERERLKFVPEDYWQIRADFETDGDKFSAMHVRDRFKQEAPAKAVMEAVSGAKTGTIASIERKSRKIPAPTPFNTTALQAAAAAEGISPARTMRIAETLYMNGYTSYPRVDNTVYPASLDLTGTVKMLCGVAAYEPYCRGLLAKEKITATRGKMETTDHPPIYPTGAGNPDKMKPEEWKLYNLIARRFLATLSGPATVEGTKVTVDVAGEDFVCRGDVLATPGFRAIYPYGLKKDDQLPELSEGQAVDFLGAELLAKQTEPPARYSQGKLIQEMEALGLGTKSTRASMIETLYDRGYVINDPIEPTALGFAICEALEKFAPTITSPDMTAELEHEMDNIANGNTSKDDVVSHSRDILAVVMDELLPRKDELGEAIAGAAVSDARIGACPKCGGDLIIKSSPRTRSRFIGCNNWPDCDVTYPLPSGKLEAVDTMCPLCGSPQIKVTPFRSKPILHCLNPACTSNQEPQIDVGLCQTCAATGVEGHLMVQKSPRTLKRFVRCTNYDTCKTSYPLPQNGALTYEGEVCPTCGSPVVVVQTRRGPWHVCINMECPAKETAAAAAGKESADDAGASSAAKATAGTTAARKSTRAATGTAAAKKSTRAAAGSAAAKKTAKAAASSGAAKKTTRAAAGSATVKKTMAKTTRKAASAGKKEI